jgi:FkbM family methyltransferase
LRSVPILKHLVSPELSSGLAQYIFLTEALNVHHIELVIDAGANVGQFGEALRLTGYRGRIVSFEPVDEAWSELSAKAMSDNKWDVFQIALGDVEGTAELAVMRNNVFSSLHAPLASQPDQFAEQNTVTRHQHVTVRRLDSLVDELRLRPLLGHALLKCDVQGHDRQVLDGLSYLNEIALLQLEVSVVPIYDGAPRMPEMLQYLDRLGFAPILLSPVTRLEGGVAVEFDYLAVNTKLSSTITTSGTRVQE